MSKKKRVVSEKPAADLFAEKPDSLMEAFEAAEQAGTDEAPDEPEPATPPDEPTPEPEPDPEPEPAPAPKPRPSSIFNFGEPGDTGSLAAAEDARLREEAAAEAKRVAALPVVPPPAPMPINIFSFAEPGDTSSLAATHKEPAAVVGAVGVEESIAEPMLPPTIESLTAALREALQLIGPWVGVPPAPGSPQDKKNRRVMALWKIVEWKAPTE